MQGEAGRESVQGVFQALARLEARQLGGSDLDRGPGLRVATFAGGALLHLEGAETDQGDILALFLA